MNSVFPRARVAIESNLHRLVEQHAAATPDKTAARFQDDVWTYQDLNNEANRMARALRSEGIGCGDPVIVCSTPRLLVLAVLLALQKIGAVYVPLGFDYPRRRIQAIVEELQPTIALISEDVSAKFQGVSVETKELQKLSWSAASLDPDNLTFDADPEDAAYILYTSGTAGEPKGIEVSYRAFSYYMATAIESYGINADDTVLSIARYSFVISFFELMCPLIVGASIHMLKRDDVLNVASLTIALEQATVVNIGPSLLRKTLTFIRGQYDSFGRFERMRHVSVGGDMVQPDLLEDLKVVFEKAELFVLYGSTEVTCMGCTYPVPRSRKVEKTYVGKAFTGMDMILLGEDGKEVLAGDVGEVLFAGPGIMSCYVKRPDLTAEAFVTLDGRSYFRTGDLGRLSPLGDLELLGRCDFQIKLHGLRIEPAEVEACLRKAPGVRDALVAAFDVEGQGKRLLAYIVPEDADALSAPDIRRFLRGRLPDYMIPNAFVRLEELPLNRNLKVDRKALLPPSIDDLIVGGQPVPPRNDVEKQLVELWAAEFGVEAIGVTDDFADLGGDSLRAITLSLLVNERFRVVLEPSEIYEHAPTIEELAGLVEKRRLRPPDGEARSEHDGAFRAQAKMPLAAPPAARFLYERKNKDPNRWNISQLLESKVPLDRHLLEQATAQIIERHDSLRLRFRKSGDAWCPRFIQDTGANAFSYQALETLADTQIVAAIEERAEALHCSLDLDRGPVFRVEHIDLGAHRGHRLLVIAHHLVVDGMSWPILVRDLVWLYEQMTGHRTEPLPARTGSYQDWLWSMHGLAQRSEAKKEADYWTREFSKSVNPIPRDFQSQAESNTNQSARSVEIMLSAYETQRIQSALPKRHSPTELFIPALTNVIARWTGADWALIDLIENSRDLPNIAEAFTQSLGFMTSNIPFLFQAVDPGGWRPCELSEAIRNARRRGFARELLSYLSEDPTIAARMASLPRAEIVFNYGGRLPHSLPKRSLFLRAQEPHGNNHHNMNSRYYPLGAIVDRDDDRILLKIVYSKDLHKRATALHLLDLWVKEIRTFIDQGGGSKASE